MRITIDTDTAETLSSITQALENNMVSGSNNIFLMIDDQKIPLRVIESVSSSAVFEDGVINKCYELRDL